MPGDATTLKTKGKRGRKRKAPEDDDDAENLVDNVRIEKVKLTHFMCYTDVKFVFSPRVNFVVGPNRSGKSALLKGIILGLGGESVTEKKSDSLKSFVQIGKEQAQISITLRNPSVHGFCYCEYGSQIKIERCITSSGQSTYKIKGLRGRVISTSKDDLASILDALNIHVDNPFSLLTQEAVQSFLEYKFPRRNYQLFYKATQVGRFAMRTEHLKKETEELKQILKKKEKTLTEYEKQLKIWEGKREKLDVLNEQEKILCKLEDEFLWSLAIEAEKEEKNLLDVKNACAKMLDAAMEQKRKIDKEISPQVCDKKELTDLHKKYDESVRKMKEENGVLNVRLRKANRDCEIYQDDADDCKRDLEEITSQIRDYNQKEEEEIQRCHRLKECEGRKQKLNSEMEELRKSISSCSECIEVIDLEHQKVRKRMDEYNCLMKDREIELQTMKAMSSEKLLRYGPGMAELLKKIDLSLSLFSTKPLGPLGNCIKVLDKQWEFAVEKCLYELLPGFCCHSESDRDLLLKIMDDVPELLSKPNIYVVSLVSEVHNVVERKVKGGNFLSILDVIHCNDQAVLNCLIEQVHVESILLIEDFNSAMNLMINNPPENCLSAFTLKGDQLHCNPKYRVDFCKEYPAACYLAEGFTAEDIETRESEFFLLKNMAETVKRKMKQLSANISQNKRISEFLKQELLGKMAVSTQIEDQIKELNVEVKIELDKKKKEVMLHWERKLTEEADFCSTRFKRSEDSYKSLFCLYESNTASLDEAKRKLDETKEKLKECERDLILLEEKKKDCNRCIRERRQELREFKELWQQAKISAEDLVARASDLCGRIEPQKKFDDIHSEILELRSILKESNCVGREEIDRNFVECKTKVEKLKKEIGNLRLKKERRESVLPKQLEQLEKIKINSALQVTLWFQQYIVSRGYDMRLKIDHEKQVLEIEGKGQQPGSSERHWMCQLTPAESSYITASLLLALYQSSTLPLHILDEYDVFVTAMDKVTSILDMALNKVRNQFIFLSAVEVPPSVCKSVKVHRLPDMEQPLNQRNTRG